jgi:hypothetical protein
MPWLRAVFFDVDDALVDFGRMPVCEVSGSIATVEPRGDNPVSVLSGLDELDALVA